MNRDEATRVDIFSDEGLELLDLLLAEEGIDTGAPAERIGRREDPAELPLSFAQQRLWFLDRWRPGTPTYNISSAFRLTGPLRPAVLARAFAEVVRRHEVLRSTLRTVEGRAVQELAPPGPFPLPVIDLERLPGEVRQAEAARLIGEEARRPFDLAAGPLLRAAALRLGAEEHVLLLLQHHIVSDGWSMGILVREVVTLYEAFAAGRPSPLPELPIQYADFAAWQRRRLQGESLEELLGWWRERLAGAPDVLDLPTDRPRPAVQGWAGSTVSYGLPAELRDGLDSLARREGATSFMVLLAAFATVLQRYAGSDDVVVGSPIANRNRDEIEGLIGFFVNTLALRLDLSGDPTFRELLTRVREMTLGAYDHQDIPFEMLVDELGLSREVSHTPLFQVTFALQNAPAPAVEVRGLTLTPLPAPTGTSKFDLALSMTETPGGLAGSIDYSTDLFDRSTIERLAGHLQSVLEGIARDPDRRLSELPLLTAEELRQAESWSAVTATFPGTGSLHRRFEEEAARAPGAVAVTGGGERLTYAELDARAGRLAGRLRARGVGTESRVCLLAERTPALVVGVLGILRAGGVYVPLDPAHPDERLAFMAKDSGASLLVAGAGFEERLGGLGLPVVALEDGTDDVEPAPSVEVDPGQAAYVIYTSGSTGRPKGVVVSHANVLRLFTATDGWFGFGADDVWTLFHSYAFDFSVWEIWGALLFGGRLVMVPYLVSRSPEAFLRLLAEERVTVLNQTPSAFRQLIQADGETPAGLALRWVVFGGEALDVKALAPWFERHGDRTPRLVNMYGITETTVHVTFRPVGEADLTGGSVLGRPIPDLSLHLLDRHGSPVPVGVPGEMRVGGAGLARGYLGRPALTAERFVPDPFGGTPGARLYRSGDLARRRPDGDLEYLGRIDHQVKVRGFRIELGEIEAAIAERSGVRQVLVLPREERGETRLVAYVVPAGEGLATAMLREELLRRLPDYMVPAAWVVLDALPLTANGKLDRRALPAPGPLRRDLDDEFAAPSTPTEELLAAVWAQVLGVDRVGVRDNFFALGGDSIRSIQVISLARERGLELSVQDLFQHQTIAGLAEAVGETAGAAAAEMGGGEPFPGLSAADRARLPEDVEDAYPLTRLQAGMLYHMALTAEEPLYHNVDSWHLGGRLDVAALQQAVARAVARHAVLRTSFDLNASPEPLQRVHREAELPVGYEDIGHLDADGQEAAIDAYMRSEKRRLFDLSHPPMLRMFVHRRSDESFQLTITENHAIFDGWSLHSTLAEIFHHYAALLAGEPLPPAPPPAVAFRDFVMLERAAVESPESWKFWSGRIDDAPFGGLPRWPGRPEARGIGNVSRPLPHELTAGLRALARDLAVPVKSVLLAAHVQALAVAGGEEDVVTGFVVNGRPESRGGEEVRGLFLNSVPFRLRARAASWRELVRSAFAAEWEMLPHRRFPLAEMQVRSGAQAFFETGFNYIHFHVMESVARSGGLVNLGMKRSEGNSYTLMTNFHQDPAADRLLLGLDYDAAQLAREQVEGIADVYMRVLESMVETSGASPDLHPLLPATELQRLAEWSGGSRDFADAVPIPQQVAAWVERAPDVAALTFADHQLTYGALGAWSGRLARRLSAVGVGPEVRVGVCLERSAELVVSLLAVLEAGGAYVPLDPAYPRERLIFMAGDAGLGALVTTRDLTAAADLPADGVARVFLEDLLAAPDREEESGPVQIDAAHLAYVIYTSGSTGRPKGVAVTHGNAARLLAATQDWFGFGPGDVWTLFHSFAFDFSVWEIWGALAHGGRLVVVPQSVSRSSEDFHELLVRERVTVLNQTPSSFRQLSRADAERGGDLALREVIFGGEALDLRSLAPWFERHGDRRPRLVNMYGITETTVHVTYRPLGAADVAAGSVIGEPIPDLEVHLLDRRLQPAPVGVPGEIFVGGAGLARGYLHRPALTAERFVPHTWSRRPGERLYRSGDLARRLPNGDLEYLGRADQQVKVRGFRIELGEIEAALAAHPAVREAVVLARRAGEDARLAAYLVPREPGAAPEPQELRAFVAERLPDYMVPAFFVTIPALPLTSSGKLDRRALPEPEASALPLAAEAVAPRDGLEEALAAIWSRLLEVERIGVFDNFFDLGGHSLLAQRIMAAVREELQVEVELRALFENPTVAGLAVVVAQAKAKEVAPEALEEALAGLEELSDEEIEALLAAGEAEDEDGEGGAK